MWRRFDVVGVAGYGFSEPFGQYSTVLLSLDCRLSPKKAWNLALKTKNGVTYLPRGFSTSYNQRIKKMIRYDIQAVYGGTTSRTELIQAANRMSRLIHARRPKELTEAQSASVRQEEEIWIGEVHNRRAQPTHQVPHLCTRCYCDGTRNQKVWVLIRRIHIFSVFQAAVISLIGYQPRNPK